jgi:GAF domain-containing protein
VTQYRANQGPCLYAARTSQTVLVDLRRDDHPLTRFAPQARRAGIQAVLSVPVVTETHTIGTLNLYSPSGFDPTAEAAAATVARQAAASAGAHRQPRAANGNGRPPQSVPTPGDDLP